MIKNAISDTNRAGIQPMAQPNLPIVYTFNSGLPVTVRLRGQQSDIEAVVDHWCIDVERRAWPAIGRNQNECVVEGRLV
jgi:hypothetical protein